MSTEYLLGVSGGIACYKAAAFCSKLVQAGNGVTVIMTPSASRFIGAPTFEALTGREVVGETFDSSYPLGPHIELARRAEIMVVAPATANLLAKAANGIADDLLSTTLLSFTGKVYLVPAMNTEMWSKPSVQRNVEQVKADGFELIGPESGWQSCRDQGLGRMSEPDQILEIVTR